MKNILKIVWYAKMVLRKKMCYADVLYSKNEILKLKLLI